MDYKARHEEFVSGLTGSSIHDVYQVSFVVTAAYLSWVLLMNRLPLDHWISVRLIDFFLNWVVPLLAITLYSEKPWSLVAIVVVPPIIQRLAASGHKRDDQGMGARIEKENGTRRNKSGKPARRVAHKSETVQKEPVGGSVGSKGTGSAKGTDPDSSALAPIPYLTAYRAAMLIMTMTAILAVDFRIFPRKFAKVETWGTSLMDLGVGSFVFSNGLMSARPLLKRGIHGTSGTSFGQVVHLSSKILSLGIIRLVGVKLLNYQEHVTEYGVHWNFFITLGVLPIALPLFQVLGQYVPMVVLGLATAIGYEIVLKNFGLMEWVLTAERTSIISQNKEGLSSTIGFIAIFLVGQSVGYFVLPNLPLKTVLYPPTDIQQQQQQRKHDNLTRSKIYTLVAYGLVFEVLFRVFRTETLVSRRLANLPYILWVCSYNTFLVAIFAGISTIAKYPASASMYAANNRGQTMFLVSNVLTGLVNMSVKTIDASSTKSIVVLIGYLGLLYSIAYGLEA